MHQVRALVSGRTAVRQRIRVTSWRRALTTIVVGASAAVAMAAPSAGAAAPKGKGFEQTNLVANSASAGAELVDPNLTNAWGLATGPNSPLWVSDNNSGNATVYSGGIAGSPVALDLTVPVPGGNPTGQVFNPTAGLSASHQAFKIGGDTGQPADFIVSSDSIGATQSPGEIAAWDGGSSFVVEDSPTGGAGGVTPSGAVFKGLALSTTPTAGPELFAADVANASVDIFDRNFKLVSAPSEFKDPAVPSGYAPFGIQALRGDIYVSYGKQNAQKTNVVAGTGLGYVDVYSSDGLLIKHLVTGGPSSPLDEPWGLAIAPKGFGAFAGKLLVGNLGNGWINVFNPTTGKFLGTLDRRSGAPIVIKGLWGLEVGNSAFGGASSVVFSAGPGSYANGLVGTLTPTP